MNNRKTPRIRFKGFTDDWEQRKLGDIGQTYTGLSGKTKEDFGHGNGKFVTYMNVFSNPVGLLEMTEAVEIDDSQRKVLFGDVLFTTSSETPEEVGMSSVWLENSENTYLNSFCFGYRPTIELNPYYLAYMLRSFPMRKKITFLAQGISRYNISKNKMMDIEIPLPSLEEQKKIGSYFRNLDHLITLHQRKLEKLKIVKKAMLENCFPKNGEKIPKFRFSGFTGDWEQRKLSELYATIGNAFVGTATPYYVESGHFYLESNNIKDGQINYSSEIFVNDEFYEKQRDKWLHTGDMVMVQSGHVGHAAVIPAELDNSAAHALIMFRNPKEKIEPYFLNYQYQTNKSKNKIESITTGNTIKHILSSDMQEFIVDMPDYNEQKKIGQYFSHLDHLITLHQRKLEKLKIIKKSFLEKMFV